MRKILLWIKVNPVGRLCAILVAILSLTLLLLILMPHLMCVIKWSYEKSGNSFGDLEASVAPYVYVGVLGIAVALAAVGMNAFYSERERRKQDTLKTLLETRVSKEFQEQSMISGRAFPSGQVASLNQFLYYYESDEYSEKIKAIAVIRVLNFYEFMSSGIRTGNLDEDMAKETVRSILCSLVHDMQDIICHYRGEGQSKDNFEHIIALFLKWAKDDPIYAESYDALKEKFLG